ncbi:uncharacterized protein LOC120284426 [Drosophila simulans]|uniref:GD11358 n=1 Tax=Drosophila simulans TaxID=7240 RepID=B4QCC5_DROSI|nr:uncharacterized protein LOC6735087 [Drosophila simulans]XP_039148044.1 uncharacterized protein LOC120284426 [Drosophila simulans]EDX07649.1 GD11358 [Drosophila simulans]KMY94799.1 uncharacterized protein Dsimw501_GD11358 [Drosophila simulans]
MDIGYSSVLILLAIVLISRCGEARKWDYEPISIIASSSDESLIKIEPSIVRLGRGKFGISVLAEWNYDTTEKTMVEAVVYCSSSGDESDYKLLPWAIPKQSFYDYLNTYYKDVIMKNFAPCSNVPQFKGKFQPPWPKQTYIGDKCVIEGEGLPVIVPPGFYKIIFNCTGPDQPSWSFVGIFKIIIKMF